MKTLSGTILVADDAPDIREILSERVNSLGCRAITAVNGQDCLDKVDKEGPDLVLLEGRTAIFSHDRRVHGDRSIF
jgi:CheY-like chemotaxis protein